MAYQLTTWIDYAIDVPDLELDYGETWLIQFCYNSNGINIEQKPFSLYSFKNYVCLMFTIKNSQNRLSMQNKN